MQIEMIAVQFSNYGSDVLAGPVVVLAAEVDAFLAEIDTSLVRVDKVYMPSVIRSEPAPSAVPAKCWWSANTGRMSRIGAGAYGDCTVWQSQDKNDHKYVWK